MPDLYDITAAEAARRIRSGALSPSNLLASCLKRIDAVEPVLKAWVLLDRDVDWDEIEQIIDDAYRMKAPKTLVKQLDARR